MTAETGTLLRYAGFVTWGLTGLPLLVSLAQEPLLLRETRYWLWLACFLIFGVIFGLTGWRQVSVRPRRMQIASLITQTAAALAMIRLVCSGQEGALLVIVAAQLGWVLPFSQALLWVFGQAAIMCAILGFSMPSQVTLRLVSTFLGFQVLGLFSCFLTARETAARADLARANRELHATRELLANTSRLAERERISRDLHDTLGHHLTALSLNLEAASHMTSPSALAQIQRAQDVTRSLLGDVRHVVSELRGEDPILLRDTLRAFVDGIEEPRIHLAMPNDLVIDDPAMANTVLRCVQEIVTNAIRHAHASNLWIELARADGLIELRARDDGRGAREIRPGHGLSGMRERVELIGGRLAVDSAPGHGFTLTAAIPIAGGRS
jgi:signal transduction histidine kinase